MVFFVFLAFKNVLKDKILWCFEEQPKCAPKMAKNNGNFSHVAKHRFMKRNCFVATPLLTNQNVVFSTWVFLKPKTLMLNKKHNLKSGKKTKIKMDSKDNKRQETNQKKRTYWWKKVELESLDVVPFMKQKQRRKKRKEREKSKESKESRKKRQEGR